METKLNIAEILKDKPKGTKLYNLLYNIDMELDTVITTDTETIVWCTNKIYNNDICRHFYSEFGTVRGYPDGLQILKPSKEMQDWSKFAWKKGDVLVSKGRRTLHVIFEGFNDDTYTTFKGKHYICDYLNKENYDDEEYYNDYHKEVEERTIEFEKDNMNNAQTYIKIIEKRLGGKLNRETLEIEKTQPEFKDGDIVICNNDTIILVKEISSCREVYFHAYIFCGKLFIQDGSSYYGFADRIKRIATEEEKQQLFEALAKEGKAWNAEKKQIVVLKPKVEFKPFDKVLVRNTDIEEWFPGFFEKFDSTWNNPYHIMNRRSMTDFAFKQCIPYEGNESLLGTTKDVEG